MTACCVPEPTASNGPCGGFTIAAKIPSTPNMRGFETAEFSAPDYSCAESFCGPLARFRQILPISNWNGGTGDFFLCTSDNGVIQAAWNKRPGKLR